MKALHNRAGQFIPITAMVAFTAVTFLVAVANVYQIARAKLKVQNLADAVALNVASQMAASMNKVGDLNEWMNHMVSQSATSVSTPGKTIDCRNITTGFPPISCAENDNADPAKHVFTRGGNASAYAHLVKTVNDAQRMFIDGYNNFIGAGSASLGEAAARASLQQILYQDIPELSEPGTFITVWNDKSNEPSASAQNNSALGPTTPPNNPAVSKLTANMAKLKFEVHHDIQVTFDNADNSFGGLTIGNNPLVIRSLGSFVSTNNPVPKSEEIGWMALASRNPLIKISGMDRHGVGATVSRYVKVPILGTKLVSATAKAFVVEKSGKVGEEVTDPLTGRPQPVFKPTYWVKLEGAQ